MRSGGRAVNKDVGFGFPFEFRRGRTWCVGGTPTSQTNAERDEAVRVGVEQVLLTNKGERVMFGDFGAGLDRFLFQPLPGIDSFVVSEVRRAIGTWSPRAVVSNVAKAVDSTQGMVAVALMVRHNDSDQNSIVRVAIRSN